MSLAQLRAFLDEQWGMLDRYDDANAADVDVLYRAMIRLIDLLAGEAPREGSIDGS